MYKQLKKNLGSLAPAHHPQQGRKALQTNKDRAPVL